MIAAFANKKINVSKEEHKYLLELEKTFGTDIFIDLFTTDKNGYITSITPSPNKAIQLVVIYAILNIMLNQRLQNIDLARIDSLEKRIAKLENRLNKTDATDE